MKKMFLVLLLFLLTVGCESAHKTSSDKIKPQAFPKVLAAVWEGYYSELHWVIKFTPDGGIEYARIPFADEFVGPNSVATFPMQGDNNTTVVKTGRWVAEYYSDGTLATEMEVIYIDAMTPVGRMEMKGTEYLIGKVDLDKGIWDAVWTTDGNYYITPLGEERTELPYEYDDGKPITLKRMVRKDSISINPSENPD
ncbi:MAG: hypothetical protein A2173_01955 [Planctomycetes bacterium RBG_13_44_8b]|nr:MAG: hypothetical protein A2173_01955 [Planctomycetes bacterium RBG_13_44_8b]